MSYEYDRDADLMERHHDYIRDVRRRGPEWDDWRHGELPEDTEEEDPDDDESEDR